jgi:periplasmic protein TonB
MMDSKDHPPDMNHSLKKLYSSTLARWASGLLAMGAAALTLLSGCSTPPPPSQEDSRPWPSAKPVPFPETPPSGSAASSLAHDAKAYRQDAASHLYVLNKDRIYKGRLPPMLEAVGVLDVDIDRQGKVKALKWKRAPKHVPQVMAEIERLARAAAPYPVPKNMSQVTYTDVWLWHKSGQFQLDTLTEGQD